MRRSNNTHTVRNLLLSACAVTSVSLCAPAFAQLRICEWNTSTSDGAQTSPRAGFDLIMQAMKLETVNGITRPMDVVTMQEVFSQATTAQSVANTLNTLFYGGAPVYQHGNVNGGSTGAGTQGIVYNSNTMQLIAETAFGTTSSSGMARQELRYQLRPVGYDSTADIYLYAGHWKASNTATDKSRRNVEAQAIRADADALGANKNILYTGDFNLYTSSEAAWATITAAGNGQASDPINQVGSWDNNSAYKSVHTQSPTTVAHYGGQVTSGMDSRFDFQLVSNNMKDGEGLSYIGPAVGDNPASAHSYHTFGNTGNHAYSGDLNVNGTGNVAAALAARIPGYSSAQAQAVLDAITNGFDHVGTVADYQLPAQMTVSTPVAPARVMLNASATASVTVTNSAPATVQLGADELDYAIATSGSTSGSASGLRYATQVGNTHNFTLTTTSTGAKTATLTVTTASQAVPAAQASQPKAVNFSVVDNRTITASSVPLGTLIAGGSASGSTTLTTTGADTSFTRVTVKAAGAGPDVNGASLAAGSDVVFNTAASTTSRNLSATFASAGAKSGSLAFTVQGEGLTGEVVHAVSAPYTATVLDHATASFVSGSTQATLTLDFGTVAAGGPILTLPFSIFDRVTTPSFTAALDLDSIGGAGDTSTLYTNFAAAQVAAGASAAFLASLNPSSAGPLSATWTIGTSDQNLSGATAPSSQTITLTLLANVIPASGPRTWNVNSNGNWTTAANWSPTGAPNAIDATATLGTIITAPRTVTVDAAIIVGTLTFDSPHAYTVAGASTLTLSSASTALLAVNQGAHTISAPLSIASPTSISTAAAASLSLAGTVSTPTAIALTKTGPGTLALSGLQSYAAGTSLDVQAGVLQLDSDATGLALTSTATLTFNSRQHLASLTMTAGAATLNASALSTDSLALGAAPTAPTSILDIGPNALVVHYVTAGAARLAEVGAAIASARNGPDLDSISRWDGPGLTSSTARSNSVLAGFDLYSVGAINNVDFTDPNIGRDPYTSFAGEAVSPSTLLVRYTYAGDADLNGFVDGDDYALIDNTYNGLIPNFGWLSGDFNYDTLIDGDDYALIDSGYLFQGAPIPAATSAVPEPTAFLPLLALLPLTSRPRRRHS